MLLDKPGSEETLQHFISICADTLALFLLVYLGIDDIGRATAFEDGDQILRCAGGAYIAFSAMGAEHQTAEFDRTGLCATCLAVCLPLTNKRRD